MRATVATIGAFAFSESPLSAVQLLWVNLIMDSLGALSLASEPPVPSLLDRPPYGRNKTLLSFHMRVNFLGHGLWQLVVLLYLLFAGAGEQFPYVKDGPMKETSKDMLCILLDPEEYCDTLARIFCKATPGYSSGFLQIS
mgnify:CR=1 FL=1